MNCSLLLFEGFEDFGDRPTKTHLFNYAFMECQKGYHFNDIDISKNIFR